MLSMATSDRAIDYIGLDGEPACVTREAVLRVSVLADGRGVIYLRPGGIVPIRDVEAFLQQLQTIE